MLMQADEWICQNITALETGIMDGVKLAPEQLLECYYQLLGVLSHNGFCAKLVGLESGYPKMIEEIKGLFSETLPAVFTAPVRTGDIVYFVFPPDEDGPAMICYDEVLEVSDQRIMIPGADFNHEEIGRELFLTEEAAQEYIDRTWGSESEEGSL